MVIMYGNGCPKCKVLKSKLESKEIEFIEVSDIDVMMNKGFMEVPKLEVEGNIYNFTDAVNWINEQ